LELEAPKSFHIMTTDIHLVKNGKIAECWHVEDWASAIEQLKDEKAEGMPALHHGQPLTPLDGMGTMSMDVQVTPETMENCLKVLYLEGFNRKPSFTVAKAEEVVYHEDYVSHANIAEAGKTGPGPAGMANIVLGILQNVPDVKWDVKEVLHAKMPIGDKYVIIAEASGTPNGQFLGIEPTGKGFNFLAVDVHWVVDGKIKETWHIEELASAIGQLTNKDGPDGIPPIHGGQPLNFGQSPQTAPGTQILASEMPECLKGFYYRALNHAADFEEKEVAEKILADKYVSHPNAGAAGTEGPYAEGFYALLKTSFWDAIPDLRFEPQAVLRIPFQGGEKYVIISSVTGTTKGEFLGLELEAPKSFHIMTTDIHLVKNGKIAECWHVEDWASAIEQLKDEKAEGMPALHHGQPLTPQHGLDAEGKPEEAAAEASPSKPASEAAPSKPASEVAPSKPASEAAGSKAPSEAAASKPPSEAAS